MQEDDNTINYDNDGNGDNLINNKTMTKHHDFKIQKVTGETNCGFCQDILWGPRALACQKCQYQCHSQCPVDITCEEYNQLMQCSPYYLCAKNPTERNKWRRWLERFIIRYSDISYENTPLSR
ncbi:hypothetical protein BDC45DRAFT_16569 [Circinella umbellata]|nr:hypothetical protein BDC45DRAFT_16569 [Circinella umbellata]